MENRVFDLIVYEGTPGGVACAVRAAREGLSVLLVNHTQHLGGMLTNGLGVWDTLYDGNRSPVYDELRRRILEHYRETYGADSPQYQAAVPGPRNLSTPRGFFEPHVAESIIGELVTAESNITLLLGYYPVAVEREGRLLRAALFQAYGGAHTVRAEGACFADASYEGDLMAVAKVPYRVGRESREEFGEPHAGLVFAADKGEESECAKYPADAVEGRLNLRGFRITTGKIYAGSTGEGDGAVQAFNFRLCVTDDPENRVLPEKPAAYRREEFLGKDYLHFYPGPNRKYSWNEGKLPGDNHAYPEGDWAAREAIMRRHLEYSLGWMYFAQNDESIPEAKRECNRRIGLPKDEYADNGHVPYEFYVREARRLAGRYVFTEHDGLLAPGLRRAPLHSDSIAATEWPMDSHECSTRKGPEGGKDGKVLLTEQTRPGGIPFRCLLPAELDNLLVPVCLSATHVGWGTVRVEPTWMNIGEAAGFAVALASRAGEAPANIDIEELLRTLASAGIMICFLNDVDPAGREPWIPAAQYFGVKGFFSDYDAKAEEFLSDETARIWANGVSKLRASLEKTSRFETQGDGLRLPQGCPCIPPRVSEKTFESRYRSGKIDATAMAHAVMAAEAAGGAGITGTEFARMLALPSAGSAPSGTLTRGQALVMMWDCLWPK